MPFLILLIFIAVPLIEIAVFIWLGDKIGILATIAIVILTAIIGVALLRHQGLFVLNRAQSALNAGRLPIDSVMDGVFLLVAGAFLLTPGLLTDTAGFLLLVPPVRKILGKTIFSMIARAKNIDVSVFTSTGFDDLGPNANKSFDSDWQEDDGRGTIIEGEIIEEAETPTHAKGDDRGSTHNSDTPWRK